MVRNDARDQLMTSFFRRNTEPLKRTETVSTTSANSDRTMYNDNANEDNDEDNKLSQETGSENQSNESYKRKAVAMLSGLVCLFAD